MGIGDFLLIIGPRVEQDRYRAATAPVVVDDLPTTLAGVGSDAAILSSPTGTFAYATHADGSEIEYVQWNSAQLADAARRGAFG